MKPKGRWPNAHIELKRLYDERVPEGMSQEEFGALYGIGSQGMVWQYLNGHRPLGIEAAAKFATGLRCTIHDICPEMAEALKVEVLPVLGRIVRKAAVIAMLALSSVLSLAPAQDVDFAALQINCVLCQIVSRWLRAFLVRWLTRFSPISAWESCA